MKKAFTTGLYLALSLCGLTQVIDPGEAAKRKATDRANSKVDQGIDKGLDKVEEGIGNLFKKKKKNTDAPKPDDKASKQGKTTGGKPANDENVLNGGGSGGKQNDFAAYSKFDFVPGQKVLYYDNFDRVEIGDFPADYNTDASGEVITVGGKEGKWLNLSKNGSFLPEAIGPLPDNFTLEMNVGILGDPSNNMTGLGFNFNTDKANLLTYRFIPGSFVMLHPGGATASMSISQPNGADALANEFAMPQWNVEDSRFARISMWRQKARLRVYVNETKLMDLPRFFNEAKPYHLSFFRDFFNDCSLLLSDIKFAAGAPDTRSKLITEGRFSTTGILFDVNSDRIKPASYGVLKEIAATLTENPAVRVKIIGHTDADGDDASNLALSKKRAAAVKATLAKEFAINESRLETDGKGESQPGDSNATPQGKANNRRVEFVKL